MLTLHNNYKIFRWILRRKTKIVESFLCHNDNAPTRAGACIETNWLAWRIRSDLDSSESTEESCGFGDGVEGSLHSPARKFGPGVNSLTPFIL